MRNHRFTQFSHGPSRCIPYHEKMRKGIRAILQKVSRYQQSVALVNVYKTPGEALTHSVYLYIFIFGGIRASHQSWCGIFPPYTESSGDAKRRGPEKQSKHVSRTWRWEGRSQNKKSLSPCWFILKDYRKMAWTVMGTKHSHQTEKTFNAVISLI